MKKTGAEASKSSDELRKRIVGIVRENLKSLTEDTSPENRRKIVCPYYKNSGESPDCDLCSQLDEEVLDACTEDYKTLVKRNPSLTFKKEYWRNKVRPKVAVDNVDFLGLNCEVCYIRDTCPEMQDGMMCSIDWTVNGGEKMTAVEVLDYMIKVQMERVQRAKMFEVLDGGMPDENLSKELEKLRIMNEQRIHMMQEKFSLKIEATANSPQVNSGGGILSKIFGIDRKPAFPEQSVQTVEISHEEIPIKVPAKREQET